MSLLQCRGTIAGTALVVALLSSRPTNAQIGYPFPMQSPPDMSSPFVTGVWYDAANQAKAERQLQHAQAKLGRDAERGDSVAVDSDVRRIERYRFRIVVDEWLIRKNSLQEPGCYPFPICLDPMSCAAIAQYTRPSPVYYPSGPSQISASMVAPSKIPITIVNAGPAGAGVAFSIGGVSYQAAGGSRQQLLVDSDSTISYDGGGSLGRRRYLISPGVYEFRSTGEGWALYKAPGMP